MKEFGSDFHYISDFQGTGYTLQDFYPKANYYADGRQALVHLYQSQGWGRLWVPEYFCYDVIASLQETGMDLRFYADFPGYKSDSQTLAAIQKKGYFKFDDAILRVNYFGMRSFRSTERLSVAAIVEDHTHDLIGGWAMNSHADWCVASLRKTLPIPEGGMLWSPLGLKLPEAPDPSEENERIANIRWGSMRLKSMYLAGDSVEKASFRAGFVETEDYFDYATVCALDKQSQEFLKAFDIRDWYNKKRNNWEQLRDIRTDNVKVIVPENMGCYPFSLVLLFEDLEERDRVRKALIANQIYPAVLWNVPSPTEGEIFRVSRGMLSIHCDARYSVDDIQKLRTILEFLLQH